MTLILAATYKGNTIISADTQVSAGSDKIKNLKNFSKIIRFPHFAVGFAGGLTVYSVLQDMRADRALLRRSYMRMLDQSDAAKFSKELFGTLKAVLEYSSKKRKESDEDDPGDPNLLLISKGSIYSLDSSLEVLEYDTFTAVGGARDLAIGAMSIIYEGITNKKELKKAVERAMEVACSHSSVASLPIHIEEFTGDKK